MHHLHHRPAVGLIQQLQQHAVGVQVNPVIKFGDSDTALHSPRPYLSVGSTDDSDRLGGVTVFRPHDVADTLQGSLRQVVTNLKQKPALTLLFFESRGDVALPASVLVHDLHQQHVLLLLHHQLVNLHICVTSQLYRCYKQTGTHRTIELLLSGSIVFTIIVTVETMGNG